MATLALTKQEVLNLFNILSNPNIKGTGKFLYVLSKNRSLLKPVVDSLEQLRKELTKDTERSAEYRKRVEELIKVYAVRPDGKPNTRPDGNTLQWVIPQEKMADFAQARMQLDQEYADVHVVMTSAEQEYARVLRELVEIPMIRTLKLSELPKELDSSVMNAIFVFVDDDTTGS